MLVTTPRRPVRVHTEPERDAQRDTRPLRERLADQIPLLWALWGGLALDSALLFAPVGSLIPVALAALDRGGTLAVAGIYVDEVPPLNYDRDLFQERRLRSVTANTRVDGEEFLAIAARIGIKVTTRPYLLAEADKALVDLSQGHLTGAAVLRVAEAH